MPDLDWTWLASINLLQVAIVIVAIWVTFRLLIRFWPWLKRAIALFDALGQLPEFITRTDKAIDGIHHETHHNGGSSLKDAQVRTEEAVERIELGIKGLYDRADAADRADEQLRHELEKTQTPAQIERLRKENKEKPS